VAAAAGSDPPPAEKAAEATQAPIGEVVNLERPLPTLQPQQERLPSGANQPLKQPSQRSLLRAAEEQPRAATEPPDIYCASRAIRQSS
jgi:hypothetical protein